jgi:hypothetical protein
MRTMRKLGIGLVVLGSLAVTAEADNYHAVLSTNGVFTSINGTTADGCVQVSGVFFTTTSDQGPLGQLFGTATDSCAGGVSSTVIGFNNVAYTSNGLGAAITSGSLETWSLSGNIAPLTFELSLAFQGTGAASSEVFHGHFVSPGGSVIMDFSASRRRSAIVTGSMTVDGGAVTLTNPFLGTGVSGELSIAR